MAQNFIECRREQGFLLPPDVREWLPADHLAWFVIDAVADMNLDAFYAAYRADGHGRAAYEPSLTVALILYAFGDQGAVVAGDRVSLSPGRGLSRDHRQRGS
jgi:transposase